LVVVEVGLLAVTGMAAVTEETTVVMEETMVGTGGTTVGTAVAMEETMVAMQAAMPNYSWILQTFRMLPRLLARMVVGLLLDRQTQQRKNSGMQFRKWRH
jgi:hypothetical protein